MNCTLGRRAIIGAVIVSSTHLFSEVKVFRSGSQLHAEITCTGGLYGTDAEGGTRITLDSWFHEVHYHGP